MDAQMKKGILEMCILHIISQEELYGYPIMKKMNGYFLMLMKALFMPSSADLLGTG